MESTKLLIFFRAAGYRWAVDCYLHGEVALENLVVIEATCAEGILDEAGWQTLLEDESLVSSFLQEVMDRVPVLPSVEEGSDYDPY